MMKNRRIWILVIITVLAVSSLFCTTVTGEQAAVPAPVEETPYMVIPTQGAGVVYPTQVPQLVYPTQTTVPLSATVVQILGTVQTLKPQEGIFNIAFVGEGLGEGDQLLTQSDGQVRFDLTDGTRIWAGPLSLVSIEDSSFVNNSTYTRLNLSAGQLWVILNGGRMDVTTPSGMASVQGSYLHVWVNKDTGASMITCLEGLCALSNQSGVVSITSGQSASISSSAVSPVIGTMSQQDYANWMAVAPEASGMVVLSTSTPQPFVSEDYPTSVFNDISLFPTATATKKPKNTKTPTPSHHNYWYDPWDNWNWNYYWDDDGDYRWDNDYQRDYGWHGNYWYDGEWYDGRTYDQYTCNVPSNWHSYYVRWGDTLAKIAYRYDTTVWQLQRANCLGSSTRIYAGTYLWVP